MLNEADFEKLDDFPGNRLRRLPMWAAQYERDLRQRASWFHTSRQRRPSFACPTLREPSWEQFNSLPVWAQLWFRTLRFEVYWQLSHARPDAEPVNVMRLRASGQPRSLVGAH